MKNTKSSKIILALVTVAMFIASVFSMVANANTAKAVDSTLSFLNGTAYESCVYEDDAVKVTAKNGESIGFDSNLAIDDFKMEFSLAKEIAKVELKLTSTYKYASGTVNTDGKLINEVDNFITFTNTADTDYALQLSVVDGVIKYSYAGNNGSCDKLIDTKTVANAKFLFIITLKDGCTEGVMKIKSVDQKQSDASGDYKQTFVLNNGAYTKMALPRVAVSADFIDNNYKQAIDGKVYTVSFTSFYVADKISDSSFYLKGRDTTNGTIWLSSDDKPNKIAFNKNVPSSVDMGFNVCLKQNNVEKVMASYDVEVINLGKDESAPTYVADKNSEAYKAYVKAVNAAAMSEDGDYSIPLGSAYQVPSMADLVNDNLTVYKNLTHTVYYRTPTTNGSSSTMKIPTDKPGKYTFYVVFTDEAKNAMDKDDFYVVNELDSSLYEKGVWFDYVFSFELNDDAPVKILAPSSQEKGKTGSQYTANNFTVDGTTEINKSNNSLEYKLYYNAKSDASAEDSGWVEIKASSVATTEKDKKINYNGKLVFTPDEVGTYMSECTATSYSKNNSASAKTLIKVVAGESTDASDTTSWLQNNVWSVVFLSIGTICLIAVVVLLFTKPKDKED